MILRNRAYWFVGLVALIAVAAALLVTSQFTFAGLADNEEPITGTALKTASKAALDHTGEGQVTGTEVGDEESYYEVEVTLDNGSQVDVQLDENFKVVGDEADDAAGEDESSPGDE